MPTHIALLRGINVGGHRVKMDRLRELFGELGFTDVWTFIASGNVVFDAPETDREALAERIEEQLRDRLGYDVATFLRSPDELRAVAEHEPAGHTADRSLYVTFLDAPADAAMRARFAEVESEGDRFTFADREIYWSIAGKLSESALFGKGIDKAIGGVPSTARNIKSVRKLVAKLS